jgi:hypothetical protein
VGREKDEKRIRRKGIKKESKGRKNKKEMEKRGKGIMDFAPYYPRYTAERSCFAKRFSKTVSDLSENLLH